MHLFYAFQYSGIVMYMSLMFTLFNSCTLFVPHFMFFYALCTGICSLHLICLHLCLCLCLRHVTCSHYDLAHAHVHVICMLMLAFMSRYDMLIYHDMPCTFYSSSRHNLALVLSQSDLAGCRFSNFHGLYVDGIFMGS